MAKIVCIAIQSLRDKINIGDVVSVHNDDVALCGAYDSFTIISVPGITAENLIKAMHSKIPDQKKAFLSNADKGKWSFDEPQEMSVWNDNGVWRKIVEPSKYAINLKDIMAGQACTAEDILSKVVVNIKMDIKNKNEVIDF